MRLIILFDPDFEKKESSYKIYFNNFNNKVNFFYYSDKKQYKLNSKNKFIEKCHELEIPVPITTINKYNPEQNYPVLLKYAYGCHSTNNFVINNKNELEEKLKETNDYQIQQLLNDAEFYNIQYLLQKKANIIESRPVNLTKIINKLNYQIGSKHIGLTDLFDLAKFKIDPLVQHIKEDFNKQELESEKIINFDFALLKENNILFLEANVRIGGSYFLSDIMTSECSPSDGISYLIDDNYFTQIKVKSKIKEKIFEINNNQPSLYSGQVENKKIGFIVFSDKNDFDTTSNDIYNFFNESSYKNSHRVY
ncbi:hypothetical protein CPAV1605_970 [seawater metagenome]|uniref:ATP-grasp domain-containing protein n=1 Tax=seawater metagenome TaxID=1561972 RepID=A0A5E8CLS1_9ZZZZ